MKDLIKLLDEHLEYVEHRIVDDELLITVKSNRQEVRCPYCGEISSKCHSLYERSAQDLPVMGKKTKLIFINRKMFCQNPNCSHKTFAERFDFLAFKSKKTERLVDKIIDISVHTSSISASRILKDGIADVGKSTVCNIIKKRTFDARQAECHKRMY